MQGINKMEKKNNKINFNIKVEEDIKNRFVSVCKNQDTSASMEIRKFMKEYLSKHSQTTMNLVS